MPLLNHAFDRTTPAIFVISSFHRARAANALFYILERKFVIFGGFVQKKTFFLAGQRCGLPQAPFLGPRNSASSKPTTEFAQPRVSSVKGRSSPARGYKFGCVCSHMAGVISHQRNDWPYGNKHTQVCTLSLEMTAL